MVVGHIGKFERISHQRTAHDLVTEVFDENLKAERVCVGVEHANIVFECVFEEREQCVHLKLVLFKHEETVIKRLVNDMAELTHLNTYQILIEYSKFEAIRLFGKPACFVLLRYKHNIAPHRHVFNGLALRSVVRQLVEVPPDFVSFALPPLLCCC